MPTTNFDLAPPGKTVDGLAAVPMDIQQITAALTFDGATSSGTGDATIDFVVGPGGGCPIFDLRQTVTAAWLDGVPLALAQVALHDFGGGVGAELRIVAWRWRRVVAHAARDLQSRHASGVDGRELPARHGLERRASSRVQLRIHRPRPRTVPRGVGAGQPDLRSVRSDTRASASSTRPSPMRSSPTARPPPLGPTTGR